jgi:hypothetical protein
MKDPHKYIRPVRLDMTLNEAIVLVKTLEGICSNGPEQAHGRWAARLAVRVNRELPDDEKYGLPSASQYYKGSIK